MTSTSHTPSLSTFTFTDITDGNICETLPERIETIEGLKSNSESPTDSYVLSFKDGTRLNGERLGRYVDSFGNEKQKKAFMKVFLSFESAVGLFQNKSSDATWEIAGLAYEKWIYQYPILSLINRGINSCFVKFLCGPRQASSCEKSVIYRIAEKAVMTDGSGDGAGPPPLQTPADIMGNLAFLCGNVKGAKRPSIGNVSKESRSARVKAIPRRRGMTPCVSQTVDTTSMESPLYDFIITRATPTGTLTFEEWWRDVFMKGFDEDNAAFDNDIKRVLIADLIGILFQVSAALYAMSMSNITHYDLHNGNVFLIPLPPGTVPKITIGGVAYTFKCSWHAQLFDFDRSVVEYGSGVETPNPNITSWLDGFDVGVHYQKYAPYTYGDRWTLPNFDIVYFCFIKGNLLSAQSEKSKTTEPLFAATLNAISQAIFVNPDVGVRGVSTRFVSARGVIGDFKLPEALWFHEHVRPARTICEAFGMLAAASAVASVATVDFGNIGVSPRSYSSIPHSRSTMTDVQFAELVQYRYAEKDDAELIGSIDFFRNQIDRARKGPQASPVLSKQAIETFKNFRLFVFGKTAEGGDETTIESSTPTSSKMVRDFSAFVAEGLSSNDKQSGSAGVAEGRKRANNNTPRRLETIAASRSVRGRRAGVTRGAGAGKK